MLAETTGAALIGVDGIPVRVEVDVAFGLPGLTIVGLPGSAVQEARERVRSALRNSGFEVPARRITVNLAPADVEKDGTAYDLAIAIGILAASGQLVVQQPPTVLLGELALDGSLRPVAGCLALAAAAEAVGIGEAVVAEANAREAAAVGGLRVHGADSLGRAVGHLAGVRPLPATPPPQVGGGSSDSGPDLAQVIGQSLGRRALEIALAGAHNLALVGPPGVGKTLLLDCVPRLLPPLTDSEAIEVSRIRSAAGLLDRRSPLSRERPVRSPHHTISVQALVGGGPRVRPGEVSLAHQGVLVLDELLHFRPDALDALRQPLESGEVTIARVGGALRLPARFALLAAFNPCPCGWLGSASRECSCDPVAVRRYFGRLSGPLRDRIDLWVTVDEPRLGSDEAGEPSAVVAARIRQAAERSRQRATTAGGEDLLAPAARAMHRLARAFRLSPRRVRGATAVAHTIADLAGSEAVRPEHVEEALRYRMPDER